jgi:predicted nucleic acid-binding protein
MFFVDSWVFLEFFQDDERASAAEAVLERIASESAVVAPTVLLEVRYQIRRKYGGDEADRVTSAIRTLDGLEVVPITADVAVTAADVRDKYYQRRDRELSYADAIHVATALLTDCETLYTGDPDFHGLDELDTEIV